MKKKISNYSGVITLLLLGAGIVIYIYKSFTPQQLAEMKNHFVNANYFYIALSLFIAFLGYVFRAYRWKYTLAEIGYYPDFKINLIAVSIGYIVNLGIPRSGEVSRALILKKYRNIPFDKAFGTIIAERIVDFIVLFGLIITSIALEFNSIKKILLEYIPFKFIMILTVVGLVLFSICVYLYLYSKQKHILLIKTKIQGLKEGVLSVMNMPNKWPFLCYTILIWMSYVLMFYLAVYSLESTKFIGLGPIIVAFVIGGLVMTFTNGGFGFFPVLIGKILLQYGITEQAGNALGWIIWVSQFFITIVLGIISFIALPILERVNKIKNIENLNV